MRRTRPKPTPRPLLIILSGPSGAGKDAILSQMKKSGYPAHFVTTVTTRPRRIGEKPDIDYHFVTPENFQRMIKAKELLEWANVYGHWYGVPRQAVEQALEKGKDVIIKVDIQGAATLKKLAPEAIFIFVMPPSLKELEKRLKSRQTETAFDLALRLKTAKEEMKKLPLFDYVVVNHQLEQAVSVISAIITAEKHRVRQRQITLKR